MERSELRLISKHMPVGSPCIRNCILTAEVHEYVVTRVISLEEEWVQSHHVSYPLSFVLDRSTKKPRRQLARLMIAAANVAEGANTGVAAVAADKHRALNTCAILEVRAHTQTRWGD